MKIENNVIASFEERSNYFSSESTWSTNDELNQHCVSLTVGDLNRSPDSYNILDYGAGPGILSKILSVKGYSVDVADISPKMLSLCSFARERILIPNESLKHIYDRIIIRQVLQYQDEASWLEFLSELCLHLTLDGRVLFSQIVPFCHFDYNFWRKLVGIRRKDRRSFPTENDFLKISEELNLNVFSFSVRYTYQSLKDWIFNAPPHIQNAIKNEFLNASSSIKAMWEIRFSDNGDIHWKNRWVNIVVGKKTQ